MERLTPSVDMKSSDEKDVTSDHPVEPPTPSEYPETNIISTSSSPTPIGASLMPSVNNHHLPISLKVGTPGNAGAPKLSLLEKLKKIDKSSLRGHMTTPPATASHYHQPITTHTIAASSNNSSNNNSNSNITSHHNNNDMAGDHRRLTPRGTPMKTPRQLSADNRKSEVLRALSMPEETSSDEDGKPMYIPIRYIVIRYISFALL